MTSFGPRVILYVTDRPNGCGLSLYVDGNRVYGREIVAGRGIQENIRQMEQMAAEYAAMLKRGETPYHVGKTKENPR